MAVGQGAPDAEDPEETPGSCLPVRRWKRRDENQTGSASRPYLEIRKVRSEALTDGVNLRPVESARNL